MGSINQEYVVIDFENLTAADCLKVPPLYPFGRENAEPLIFLFVEHTPSDRSLYYFGNDAPTQPDLAGEQKRNLLCPFNVITRLAVNLLQQVNDYTKSCQAKFCFYQFKLYVKCYIEREVINSALCQCHGLNSFLREKHDGNTKREQKLRDSNREILC